MFLSALTMGDQQRSSEQGYVQRLISRTASDWRFEVTDYLKCRILTLLQNMLIIKTDGEPLSGSSPNGHQRDNRVLGEAGAVISLSLYTLLQVL